MIRALTIELRRSPLRWVLPLLLIMTLGMLFLRDTRWVGVWPEASAASQNPAWFIAPVLAAGAAWAAGRVVRAGATEQFGAIARPAWQREALQLSASLLFGIVPLAAGAVAAAVATVPAGGTGFLWPSYLLLGFSLVAIATALGHLIGRLHRSFLAPLIAAAAVIGVLVADVPKLSVLSGPPHLSVSPTSLLSRLLLAAALIFAAVAVGALVDHGQRRMRDATLTTAGSVVAVLLALTAALATPSIQQPRKPPAEPLCSAAAPQVCVWPEHHRYLSDLVAAAAQLATLQQHLDLDVPDQFNEHGLTGSAPEHSEVFALHLGGEWMAMRGMVTAVLNATFADEMCPPADSEASELRLAAQLELREWLVGRAYGGPKPPGFFGGWREAEEVAARVLEQPDRAQFGWAQERIDTIREPPCAP